MPPPKRTTLPLMGVDERGAADSRQFAWLTISLKVVGPTPSNSTARTSYSPAGTLAVNVSSLVPCPQAWHMSDDATSESFRHSSKSRSWLPTDSSRARRLAAESITTTHRLPGGVTKLPRQVAYGSTPKVPVWVWPRARGARGGLMAVGVKFKWRVRVWF